MAYQIILHGSAHNLDHEEQMRREKAEMILEEAKEYCNGTNSAIDVCEKIICLLEDEPMFNAGTGGFLQMDGKVRMDAAIMDSNLRAGAVIQIENVRHPISIAKILLEKSLHSTLSGLGATLFALEQGFSLYNPVTQKQSAFLQSMLDQMKGHMSYDHIEKHSDTVAPEKLGTVGCVVRDPSGLIVAGTSTGGLSIGYPGRVGDSGIIGSGTYANSYGGISCTGIGEKIMRLNLARLVSWHLEMGQDLQSACDHAIMKMREIDGEAAVIAIDAHGNIGHAFTTKYLTYAHTRIE